ncbi:MAG: hydratase [Burkholderiaceae bacterium]
MSPQDLLAHADAGTPWTARHDAPLFDDREAAYRAALAVRAQRIARGERPRGVKIGFTNRTIWQRYGVFAPIWGTVYDSTLGFCDGEGRVSLAHTCQPRIEPEVVFGLRQAPPRDADLQGLYDAIEWIATGFEVVQSHCPGWRFSAAETMADGGLHARLLVGARQPLVAVAPDAQNLHARLAEATVSLHRGDEVVDRGRGANVLDSPLAALLHVVRELRDIAGAPELQGGDVITTGTWTDAWPVQPGQRWTARFAAPLAPITVTFE